MRIVCKTIVPQTDAAVQLLITIICYRQNISIDNFYIKNRKPIYPENGFIQAIMQGIHNSCLKSVDFIFNLWYHQYTGYVRLFSSLRERKVSMCELLGFTASKPTDISDYLRLFYAHSVRHPHGWGMMYEEGGERAVLHEPVRACDSSFLSAVIDSMEPQKAVLGHIRFATVGNICEENCHPYTGYDLTGREWTLIHNGTIYSSKMNYQYNQRQAGNTDSERLFLALLDTVNERIRQGNMEENERFLTVSQFIEHTAPHNKLNLMIWDGELLYVHKNLKNTLCYKRLENGCLFSTTPLDDGTWIPFPIAQVMAFRDGREAYRGARHKGIYVPSLEYITAMCAMNI